MSTAPYYHVAKRELHAPALGPGKTTSRSAPCPTCGRDGCRVFSDGRGLICRHVPSDRPKNGGYYHAIGDQHGVDWRDQLAPPPVSTPSPTPVDDARAAIVYAALLAACPLSDAHRRDLHARGLTDAEIEADGYAALPTGNRAAIVRDVIAAVGEPVGVPGFYRRAGTWQIAGRAGLLIPIRPTGDAVTRIKIRVDRPGAGPKYVWFSTPDQDGGAGSGAVGHLAVAEPQGCPRSDERDGARVNRRLYLTEGPIKANIAARKLSANVFAIPGVNALGPMIAALPAWRQAGITDIVLAFDIDRETNPRVAEAHDQAVATLTDAGFTVFTASWPAEHKGIDDALVASAVIRIERSRQDEDLLAEIAALKVENAELKAEVARMSGFFRAVKAPKMGPERQSIAAIATYLDRHAVDTWVMMPHGLTEELTGKSRDTIARDLKKSAGLLEGRIETKLQFVKAYGRKTTFRRLIVPAGEILDAIARFETPKPTPPADLVDVTIVSDTRVFADADGELLSERSTRRQGRRRRPAAAQTTAPATGSYTPQLAAPSNLNGGDEIAGAGDLAARQTDQADPAPIRRKLRCGAVPYVHRPPDADAARRTPPHGNAQTPTPTSTVVANIKDIATMDTAPDAAERATTPPRSDEGRRPAIRIHEGEARRHAEPRRAGPPPAFGIGAAFGTAGYDKFTEA